MRRGVVSHAPPSLEIVDNDPINNVITSEAQSFLNDHNSSIEDAAGFVNHSPHTYNTTEERRQWNEKYARSYVRSKFLSTYGGLGYQQSRLGETLFECVKYDAVEHVARIISVQN